MQNEDLIAFLQPAPHRFDPHAWRDVTTRVTAIEVTPHRLRFRLRAAPGLYRGLIRTRDGAFDMRSACVEMTQVPTGRKVSVGPWDLDHLNNVMAVPMARTWVNGRLLGGLWFAMPGPEDIRANRLTADFGFEVERNDVDTEVVLEFVERDRARISWHDMLSIELRHDDRRPMPIEPVAPSHPRIYLTADELPALRERLADSPEVEAIRNKALLRDDAPGYPFDPGALPNQPRHFATDALVALLTSDDGMVERVTDAIAALCERETWSGRPDPLLMGGENDRGIGVKLYACGLAWDYLREAFTPEQRERILSKVDEYIRKMYDFTVLQRAYMGCPSTGAHSTGAWNGAGIACMAFYEDLPVARRALPLFHGLFVDSLKLFPRDGKAKSTTLTPWHLVRYLAAAHTFGGMRPELQESAYLDRLGEALLACFRTPSTQDMQRGRRTFRERYLTAFLGRFHHTHGIEAIYHAFLEQERVAAGDVQMSHFDLLYAPPTTAPAPFPDEPYYARDSGQLFAVTAGPQAVGVQIAAGLMGGATRSFSMQSHNRSFPERFAGIEIAQDGKPVVVNVSHTNYGIDSSLANTMCFEDGGLFCQGQYLPGEVGPEFSASIRRYHRSERFIYVHALVGPMVDPELAVRQAERIVIVDRHAGTVLVKDAFVGDRPLRYGTHLHASGRIEPIDTWCHRLTGGQANLIAGIKGGAKDMTNEAYGELYVTALAPPTGSSVQVGEAPWIPSYIYGINNGKNDDPSQAKYPHYQRWRWQLDAPVRQAELCYALTCAPDAVRATDAGAIDLADEGRVHLTPQAPVDLGAVTAEAEAILHDHASGALLLLGTRRLTTEGRRIIFDEPVDIQWENGDPRCFATHPIRATEQVGFELGAWEAGPLVNPPSHGDYQSRLALLAQV